MCLAIPTKIVKLLDNQKAMVAIGEVEREISIALVPDAREGEYVIVHVGYALSRLDEEEALKTIELFESMEALKQEEEGRV